LGDSPNVVTATFSFCIFFDAPTTTCGFFTILFQERNEKGIALTAVTRVKRTFEAQKETRGCSK
jgi:hypothetical protein